MLKMNSAKSYKILILIVAMVMSFVTAFALMVSKTAFAEDGEVFRPSYVNVYDQDDKCLDAKVKYQKVDGDNNDVISATVAEGDVVKFENKLVLAQGKTAGDLAIGLEVPEGMQIKLVLTATALDPNGNKTVKGEEVTYEKEIVYEYDITSSNDNFVLGLEDNLVTFNGSKIYNQNSYMLDVVGNKVVVSIAFKVVEVENDNNFKIINVNQFATADNAQDYNQTFEIDQEGKLVKTATPRVVLPKTVYAKTTQGYELRKVDGVGYDFNYGTITMKAYRLTDKTVNSDSLSLDAKNRVNYSPNDNNDNDNDYSVTFSIENNSKFITFNLADRFVSEKMSFEVMWGDIELESFEVTVIPATVEGDYENQAPTINNEDYILYQLESYQKALEQKTVDSKGNSIALGKSFTIPSMDHFIADDNSSYNELTKKYYYITPSKTTTQTSTTTMKLDVAGIYKVYVMASEKTANEALEMESNLFYDVKDAKYLLKDGDEFTEVVEGTTDFDNALDENKYFIYIFTFEIGDDSPISVTANKQDDGFVGVKYKAEKFVVSDNTTTVYKLYYNSNVNAKASDSGWVEIINKNEIPENGANGYTYDELTEIGFDNSALTFTPNKVGAYKLECEVKSKVQSGKSDSASVVIAVRGEPTEVVVPTYWFRDNLASIIFLGIGTLCLIGIVILLLIKPKDELEAEVVETPKTKKKASK